jgi:predicted metal-dependent hydrolase
MNEQITLDNIPITVVRKKVKNLHLKVTRPTGCVHVVVPLKMKVGAIHSFIMTHLDWVKQTQKKIQEQPPALIQKYCTGEMHYFLGKLYPLQVTESHLPPAVEIQQNEIHLRVRVGDDEEKRLAVMDAWYRAQLKPMIADLIATWEPLMAVKVEQFFIQRMKTRWGSCNIRSKNIRLNTELAKKPFEQLEYVVIHEMVHLLEPSHNHRFKAFMDQFMPGWRVHRKELNRYPLGYDPCDEG